MFKGLLPNFVGLTPLFVGLTPQERFEWVNALVLWFTLAYKSMIT